MQMMRDNTDQAPSASVVLQDAHHEASRKAAAVAKLMSAQQPAERRLRDAAAAAGSGPKKVLWLQRAADLIVRTVDFSGLAACRPGCSHCCHIPVIISRPEAAALAAHVRRQAEVQRSRGAAGASRQAVPAMCEEPPEQLIPAFSASSDAEFLAATSALRSSANERHLGSPCPFLSSAGSCTAYEARPLACRLHFSLAADGEPCKSVDDEGRATPMDVPLLDVTARQVHNLIVLGPTQPLADIRDWFPSTSESNS